MVSSNDVKKLFLQAILSRKYCTETLAIVLWKQCVEAIQTANDALDIATDDFRSFVDDVNDSINALDLELAHMHDEVTGKNMYALVNRNGDEIAQIATEYTPVEIAFFKTLVEQIMVAPNESYSISSMAALREVVALKANMTKSHGEDVLASFVARGWLWKSKRGRYCLSTRTVLELLPYLKTNYPDECNECLICYEILTRGVRCFTPNCQTRLHNHCFDKYRENGPQFKCPSCSEDWAKNAKKLIPVGEKAATADDDRRRRRRTTAENSDADPSQTQAEDNDSMYQDDLEATQAQSQAESSRTGPSGKRPGRSQSNNTSQQLAMQVDEDDSPPPRTKSSRRRG